MLKNLTITFFLLLTIATGIGYAIYSAPELPEHRLFELALKQFSNNAESLEKQFKDKRSIDNNQKQLTINYIDLEKLESLMTLTMLVQNNLVTLQFTDGNTALANQTIVLEPYFARDDSTESEASEQTVRWKCLGGSVLIRFRTRDCRLGYGFVTSEFLNKFESSEN